MVEKTGANATVRPAHVTDAAAIGTLQATVTARLLTALTGVPVERIITQLTPDKFTSGWRATLADMPSRKHWILVAENAGNIVAFAAVAPGPGMGRPLSEDELETVNSDSGNPGEKHFFIPIANMVAFEASPSAYGAGDADRLLHAAADILRGVGARRLEVPAIAGDEEKTRLLSESGFAATGIRRSYEIAGQRITEHLWATSL
ncbi:MAG: hypothetical protein SOS98_02685 [Varibaculum sp.]|nr:hypothetical protein [Varibaculum sp.]